jgi:hypothetical protein
MSVDKRYFYNYSSVHANIMTIHVIRFSKLYRSNKLYDIITIFRNLISDQSIQIFIIQVHKNLVI